MNDLQQAAHDLLLKVQCQEGINGVCAVLKELLRGTTKLGCLKVLSAVEDVVYGKSDQ